MNHSVAKIIVDVINNLLRSRRRYGYDLDSTNGEFVKPPYSFCPQVFRSQGS